MSNDKVDLNVSFGGWFVSIVLAGILGYFVYDNSFNAALGIIIVMIVINITFMLSLIPIFGWIAAVLACHYYIIPKMLEIVSLEYTWLITAIFVVAAFSGLIITILMIFLISAVLIAVLS